MIRHILKENTNRVRAVAFSPNNNTLASGAYDGSIIIWNTATAEHELKLEDHLCAVFSMSYNSDGTMLASASFDMTIKVWNLTGEKPTVKYTITGHSAPVFSVAFSPNGKMIASCSDDGVSMLWYATTGEQKFVLKGHLSRAYCVAWSHDNTLVASASGDMTVRELVDVVCARVCACVLCVCAHALCCVCMHEFLVARQYAGGERERGYDCEYVCVRACACCVRVCILGREVAGASECVHAWRI
jgi:WD40 repeat protein